MDAGKQIYLLLVCQGFYLGSVCQLWTFPEKLTALLGSCVEVPCTYDPGERLGASSPVWYLYSYTEYPEILNTKDASSVDRKYRDRTSLVPGNNSCTLRIDPVTKDDADSYYPGIAEDRDTNAFKKQGSLVQLTVTDKVNYVLSVPDLMTEGDAAIMYCAVFHTCGSSPPSLQWNKPGTVKNKSVKLNGGFWSEESELTYIPSYVDDGTPVQCTVIYLRDQYPGTSKIQNIDYAPKNVTVTVIGTYEEKEGDDVTLKCNCISKTRIETYEWYKGKGKTKLMESKQTITVKNMTKVMELYGCAAINRVGRGESDLIEIQVRYAATEVHIIVKNDRESTELTCVFLSSWPDVTHYTWMKNGTVIPNKKKKTLILENNEERYGEYLCIAHNKAGNFSSEEILIERQYNEIYDGYIGYTVNLPLILGRVVGVFVLLVLIMVTYFYLRHIKKSALPNSPIHGTASARLLYTNTMAKDESQYENIQRNHHAHPPSMGSEPSHHMKVEENCDLQQQ